MKPARRRLIAAWLMLMGLTVAMALAADVGHVSRLGPLWLIVIGVVTVTKARVILRDYLGLRQNRGALAGMTVAVALTATAVVGAFLVVRP